MRAVRDDTLGQLLVRMNQRLDGLNRRATAGRHAELTGVAAVSSPAALPSDAPSGAAYFVATTGHVVVHGGAGATTLAAYLNPPPPAP